MARIGKISSGCAHLYAGISKIETVGIGNMESAATFARVPPVAAAVALAALDHPTRLTVVRALAGGARMSIVQLAPLTGQPPDQVAKHLKRLREAGILVAARRAEDTRRWDHEIPAGYRVTDAAGRAALDFGGLVLRLE